MKKKVNKCLLYFLYCCNCLLGLSGLCITGLSVYECFKENDEIWYVICFGLFGFFIVLSALYGFIAKSDIGLISLYLSIIAIIGSFHISFTIGILVNSSSGHLHLENKFAMSTFLSLIGVVIILTFIASYLHRNSIQAKSTTDSMISLRPNT